MLTFGRHAVFQNNVRDFSVRVNGGYVMIYTLKNEGSLTAVDLKGRLTFADYSLFREIISLFNNPGFGKCRFDLSELEFIDSAGLGMLLLARDKMEGQKGQLVLRGAQGQVKRMFELGRLDTLFVMEQ